MIRVKRNTYLEGRIKVFPDPNDVLIRGKEEKGKKNGSATTKDVRLLLRGPKYLSV